MKQTLAKFMLVFISVVISLCIIEGGLRFVDNLKQNYYLKTQQKQGQIILDYDAEFVERFYPKHPILDKHHATNANLKSPFHGHPSGYLVFRTNNLGLRRDEDVSIEKPAGIRRVLVLGDSMTDGVIYNAESYSTVLETKLNQRLGESSYQLLNAGVAGYSPLQAYLLLKLEMYRLQPDVVILAIYTGNDIMDLGNQLDDPSMIEVVQEAGYDVNDDSLLLETGWWSQIKWYTRRNLKLYPILWQAKQGVRNLWRNDRQVSSTDKPANLEDVHGSANVMGQVMRQAVIARDDPQKAEAAFRLQEIVLQRLAQEVEALGAKLLVIVIPTKLQIEPDDDHEKSDAVAKIVGLEGDALHFDEQVGKRTIKICEDNQIPVLDLEPALRTMDVSLFWRQDWHLNVMGNETVATAIDDYFQSHSELLENN
jgi:lysophospholipase L1-like esterase